MPGCAGVVLAVLLAPVGWARDAAANEVIPEVPPPTRAAPVLPDKLGPVRIVVGDHHSFQVGGAIQLQLNGSFPIDAPPTGGASLRRLRLDLRASLQDGLAGFRVQLNLLPGTLELVDAVLTSRADPRVAVSFGFQKVPFTRYRQQSFTVLPLVDWAVTTRMFGAERQLGLLVQDGWQQGVSYGVGVFAGTNSRASHGVGLSEVYGVPLVNPSNFLTPGYDLAVHPEVVARLGWNSADVDALAPVDRVGGPPRASVLVSAAVDARPTPMVDLAARVAPEVLFKVHHVSVSALWYGGWFVAEDGPWRFGVHGALASVTWRAHRFFEVTAQYAGVYRLPALADDVVARGVSGRSAGAVHEAGIGWTVPTLGDHFDWTTDVAWVGDAGGKVDRQVRIRSLIQVAI